MRFTISGSAVGSVPTIGAIFVERNTAREALAVAEGYLAKRWQITIRDNGRPISIIDLREMAEGEHA